jgi:hypothetical protein
VPAAGCRRVAVRCRLRANGVTEEVDRDAEVHGTLPEAERAEAHARGGECSCTRCALLSSQGWQRWSALRCRALLGSHTFAWLSSISQVSFGRRLEGVACVDWAGNRAAHGSGSMRAVCSHRTGAGTTPR